MIGKVKGGRFCAMFNAPLYRNIVDKIMDALLPHSPQYWIMKAVLGGYNPPGYPGEDPPTPYGVIENYLYREAVPRSARHAIRIIERLRAEGYDITRRVQVIPTPPESDERQERLSRDEALLRGPW